jgi:hypothetical protein
MAVPDTRNTLESELSAFSGSLNLGITSSSSTPNVPSNAPPAAQTLPGSLTNLLATPLSMDPVSEYQAAASLYQQVKLLNESLKNAPRFKDYDAYIVSVQVTLMPYRRNAPYDAYDDLTFFCASDDGPTVANETMPIIFPIITSDQLEAASDQQSINNLTSLSLALSAAYHGVGAQAAINQLNQNLNEIMGNNLNSLMTVGKITRNTIEVRLGARNSTSNTNGLTMVPEAHTIAFLALAPHNAGELEMISDVTLRDAANGRPLRLDLKEWGKEINAEFDNQIFGGYLGLKPDEIKGLWSDPPPHKSTEKTKPVPPAAPGGLQKKAGPENAQIRLAALDKPSFRLALFQHPPPGVSRLGQPKIPPAVTEDTQLQPSISRLDFQNRMMNDVNSPTNPVTAFSDFCRDFTNYFTTSSHFNACYLESHSNVLSGVTSLIATYSIIDFNTLWQDITKIQESQYESDLTAIPHWQPCLPPINQTVIYTDDGQTTTFTLNAGKEITSAAGKMSAVLTLTKVPPPNTVSNLIYSDQIQMSGNNIKVAFPALSAMASAVTNPFELDLILETNDEAYLTAPYTSFIMLKNKPTPPPPAWSIVRTYGLLIAGPTNVFTIVLANSTNAIATTNYLDIENPQIVSETSGGVLGNQINEVYTLVVTNNNFATFTFGPLITGQNVNFNLLGPDQKFIATLATAMVYPPNSSQTTSSSTSSAAGSGASSSSGH